MANFRVTKRDNEEDVDDLIRRFKRLTKKEKIIQECSLRESFYSKKIKRKLKHDLKYKK